MSRRLVGSVALAVLALAVEPLLGGHGHWPAGTSVLLGLGGSLLLTLGAKALGAAGLQRPDPGNMEEEEDS
jgi:hypothetical protein